MRDNPKENLRRLEEELLEEELMDFDEFAEESDEEDLFLKEIYDLIGTEKSNTAYRNYSNNYGQTRAASAYSTDAPLPDYRYDEPEEEAPRKGGNGLVVAVCLEALGIIGVVVYWLVRFF